MNSADNFMSRFEIEIENINFRELSSTWEAVNNRLNESEYFGKTMEGCAFLNSMRKRLKKIIVYRWRD